MYHELLNSYRIEWTLPDGFTGAYYTKNPWIARMVRDRAVKFGFESRIFMLAPNGSTIKEVF